MYTYRKFLSVVSFAYIIVFIDPDPFQLQRLFTFIWWLMTEMVKAMNTAFWSKLAEIFLWYSRFFFLSFVLCLLAISYTDSPINLTNMRDRRYQF
jgi:hypothetical protein